MSIEIRDRLRQRLYSPEEALAHQERMNRDLTFLLSHMDEWRQLHPDCWVAVYDEELIAVADTQDSLLGKIQAKGVPLPQVIIDFVSKERVAYLL